MVTTDPTTKALAELDRLSRALTDAEDAVEKARPPLLEAAIRHLRERNAPPNLVSDHTPWDRNWVRVRAREAGVPPLKGPNVTWPAPVYEEETQKAALAELDALTAKFTAAEQKVEKARKPLHAAIVKHYTNRTVRPGVLVEHIPYDRVTMYAILKAAEASSLRPRK